jgi:hypothetical protein
VKEKENENQASEKLFAFYLASWKLWQEQDFFARIPCPVWCLINMI